MHDTVLHPTPPAQNLLGLTLPDGWIVTERLEQPEFGTGGWFSVQYLVQSPNGTTAFLKALDFSTAMTADNPAAELEPLISAFNFESRLCEECRLKRLSRVVHPITFNKVQVDATTPFGVVQYIIFELGHGDVRKILDELHEFDLAVVLRAAHNVAVGIQQLHGIGVAHQDVKPSNILGFRPRDWKIADLGSASRRDSLGPWDAYDCAGDVTYAPPERLYGYSDPNWGSRRLACDLYLLGNFIVFLFARTSITACARSYLHQSHDSKNWGGTFDEALVYLREAYDRAFQEIVDDIPNPLRADISRIVRQLCDPDPKLRGDPPGNYRVERFISHLDRLATAAEHRLLRNISR